MNEVEKFCSNILHEYLENCNYDIVQKYIDPSISVIGTGGLEFFLSVEEFINSLQQEQGLRSDMANFVIEKEQYWSQKLSEDLYLVVIRGLVKAIEPRQAFDCMMEFRFSVVLKKYKREWKILHIHQSTPDPNQAAGEFFPNGMIENLNRQLREQVEMKTCELKKMNDRLQHMVEHDYLTGLYNRSYFEKAVMKRIEACKENKGAFMMLDVDRFKQCNDKYGHLAGDKVLTAVGKWMMREFPDGITARYGGDEFAVFFEDADVSNSDLLAPRIEQAILSFEKDPVLQTYGVTISAGIAFFRNGETMEQLYRYADQALYKAKQEGKSSCCIADRKTVE